MVSFIRKIPRRNEFDTSLTKYQHNEFMSTSSSDSQSFFSMTENESHGKVEQNQKGEELRAAARVGSTAWAKYRRVQTMS